MFAQGAGVVQQGGREWKFDAGVGRGSLTPYPSPGGRGELHSGADGAEVDEPVLEQGAGHGLQGLVAAAVEFDLVVQRAEDVGDGALFGLGWQPNFESLKFVAIQTACAVAREIDSGEKPIFVPEQ